MATLILTDKSLDFLQVFTENAWKEFLPKYQAYSAKAGKKGLHSFISPAVQKQMERLFCEEGQPLSAVDETELIAKVEKLFAPEKLEVAYKRLSRARMPDNTTPNRILCDYLSFELDFQRLADQAVQTGLKEKDIVKVFITGLRPQDLQDRVQLSHPRTLKDAYNFTLKQVRDSFRGMESFNNNRRENNSNDNNRRGVGGGNGGGGGAASGGGAAAGGGTGNRPQDRPQARFAPSPGRPGTGGSPYNGGARQFSPGASGGGRQVLSTSPAPAPPLCLTCGQRHHGDCPRRQAAALSSPAAASSTTTSGSGAGAGAARLGQRTTTPATPVNRPWNRTGGRMARTSSPGTHSVNAVVVDGVGGGFVDPAMLEEREVMMVHAAPAPSHQDSRPRCHVRVSGNIAAMDLVALSDSGSQVNIVSSSMAESMETIGCAVSRIVPVSLRTVSRSTPTTVDRRVHARVSVVSGGRTVEASADFLVLDMQEEMIIGWSLADKLGLLVAAATDPHFDHSSTGMGTDPRDIPVSVLDEFELQDGELPVPEDCPQRDALLDLLEEFSDIFSEELPPEGAALPPMKIELTGIPKPIPPRRMTPQRQAIVENEVKKLLDAGIVRKSTSSFSSPVVLAGKKDESHRLCIDYRSVNKLTVPYKAPMAHGASIQERLRGHSFFSSLDLFKGYHQCLVAEEDVPKTAFATHRGLFEFVRVPFGLTNAPAYFQQAMYQALEGYVGWICEVFIDDVVVYGRTAEELLDALRLLFQRFREVRLRLRFTKCRFMRRQIRFLGWIVNGNGFYIDPDRIRAIANLAPPTDRSGLRSLLGVLNFVRQFVPHFASLVRPLTDLTSPRRPFLWTAIQEQALHDVKEAIIASTPLFHVDPSRPLIVQCDASRIGLGGVCFQYGDDDMILPIAFVSRAFTPAEQNYPTIEQELLAIFETITRLEPILGGTPFTVYTDHRNLVYLNSYSSPRLTRWRMRLQEFPFDVCHIDGTANVVADGLSRALPAAVDVSALTEEPVDLPAAIEMEPEDEEKQQHQQAIEMVHNAQVGHFGADRTLRMLKEQLNGELWSSAAEDVKEFILTCPICQLCRLGKASMIGALATTMTESPFDTLCLDTIGPVATSLAGNKYIITAMCAFTRFVELKACKEATAMEAAVFIVELAGRYGPPATIRSDGGSQYTADVIKHLCELMGTKQHVTLAYTPSTNGLIERQNGEVGRHLRALCVEQRMQPTWDLLLPVVQRIINAHPHSVTGYSPAKLLFGGVVDPQRNLFASEVLAAKQNRVLTYADYVQQLMLEQTEVLDLALKHQQQEIQNRLDKAPVPSDTLSPGDLVLVERLHPRKLETRWKGPLVVVHHRPTNVYLLQELSTQKVKEYHLSRIKPYKLRDGMEPTLVEEFSEDTYEVEDIVGHRSVPVGRNRVRYEFEVVWSTIGDDGQNERTFEPPDQLKHLDCFKDYLAAHKDIKL